MPLCIHPCHVQHFQGIFPCGCPYTNLHGKASSILVSNNIANADTSGLLHAPAMSVNVREIIGFSAGSPKDVLGLRSTDFQW